MKAICHGFAALLLVAGVASGAQGGTVRVQAGDHDGFTRLVISPDKKTDWSLGRTTDGYELRLTDTNAQFDLGQIFDKIRRNRIADIGPAARPGALGLTLGCDCHATAFAMSGGRIVIDLGDGPPEKTSAFEQDFAASDQGGSSADKDAVIAEAPSSLVSDAAGPSSATLTFRRTTDPTASLPSFWKGYGSAIPRIAAVDGETLPTQDPPAPISEATPKVPTPTLMPFSLADFSVPQSPLPLPLPDAAIRETEEELLRQLGRAASQGLVALPDPAVAKAADPIPAQAEHFENASKDTTDRAPPHTDTAAAFFAETSLDRDTRDTGSARHLTPVGSSCILDSELNIASWGTNAPAAAQISTARADLTQEFDRADPKAIEKLVKLYLFLGMGHEARQVLLAFPVKIPNTQLLADVGTLLDGGTLSAQSPLHEMRDCDTEVALWSFLGAPTATDVKLVDTSVVVRAFSGLPAQLRHILARQLANRMSEIGADDAARAVRNALARRVGADDREVGMLDAERALGQGRLPAAEAKLDRLAAGNDQIAAQAVLFGVTSRLNRAEVPSAKMVETAAALAFEKQDSPEGAAYAQAAILGQAALGSFDEAVASYRRWRDKQPESDRTDAAAALMAVVTDKADDSRFLSTFFGAPEILTDAATEAPVRMKLAARLVDLGFGSEARAVLGPEMAQSDAGRLLAAKVALTLYRPQEAQEDLQGLAGPDAEQLRAAALAMGGDPRAAAPLLAALGNADAAARAAWSGGDFSAAAAQSQRMKSAAEGLGLLGTSFPSGPAGATLSGSKALLAQSAGVRQALDSLLGASAPANVPSVQAPTASAPKGG